VEAPITGAEWRSASSDHSGGGAALGVDYRSRSHRGVVFWKHDSQCGGLFCKVRREPRHLKSAAAGFPSDSLRGEFTGLHRDRRLHTIRCHF
jgi:hypothetical protein